MRLKTGRAVGGPYHGIKLTASIDWVGLVKKHTEGRYEWDSLTATWRWQHKSRALPPNTNDLAEINLRRLRRTLVREQQSGDHK